MTDKTEKNGKTLLIVESPSKIKTIEKMLGPEYIVKASYGHIRQLVNDKKTKNIGIDINNNFEPSYEIMQIRSKQINDIKAAMKTVSRVLLASDDDREGEAIAWHLAIVLRLNLNDKNRIVFHEITKNALEQAILNPRKIDMDMLHSQMCRQVLDKLIGFKISATLWQNLPGGLGLSAGRVQSVCLKLVADKELEIKEFVGKNFFKTTGDFNIANAVLDKEFSTSEESQSFLNTVKTSEFSVNSMNIEHKKTLPPPPYITSTIQVDLGKRFGLSSKGIMGVLQKLYENGKISYHRTDSVALSSHIINDIKKHILDNYGENYLKIRVYGGGGGAKKSAGAQNVQAAHEAIRPSYINIVELDGGFTDIDKKVYCAIWNRTVSSQMTPYEYDAYNLSINISGRDELFKASTNFMTFDGFKRVYTSSISDAEESSVVAPVVKKAGRKKAGGSKNTDENEVSGENSTVMSEEKNKGIIELYKTLKIGDKVAVQKIVCSEKSKNPPARYSETSIVKQMETLGIGRPSTYSNMIEKNIERMYVEVGDIEPRKMNGVILSLDFMNGNSEKTIATESCELSIGGEKKRLCITRSGEMVFTFLEQHFNNIFNYQYTSELEKLLDSIAENPEIVWNNVVKDCYDTFYPIVLELMDKGKSSETKKTLQNKRLLGELNGKNISVYLARYGPLIQIGEDKEKNYVKLDDKFDVNTVQLEDIVHLLEYPKSLGSYNGEDIIVKNGRYGYYISYNKKNYKFINGYDKTLSFDDAVKCIEGIIEKSEMTEVNGENGEASEANEASENKSGLIKEIGKYVIRNGPYGPYIIFNKKFYKIPKNSVPVDLTEDDCKKIIDEEKTKPKKVYKKYAKK